jgi:hypothetical protein
MMIFELIISKSNQNSGATPNGCTFGALNGVIKSQEKTLNSKASGDDLWFDYFKINLKIEGLWGMNITRVHTSVKIHPGPHACDYSSGSRWCSLRAPIVGRHSINILSMTSTSESAMWCNSAREIGGSPSPRFPPWTLELDPTMLDGSKKVEYESICRILDLTSYLPKLFPDL